MRRSAGKTSLDAALIRMLIIVAVNVLAFIAPLPRSPSLGHGGNAAWAQSPLRQHDLVARGRQLFEDQQYDESIQTLSAALLRPNNTREQKVEIFRLLALDYITLGRKDEAESAVRGLLALDAHYELPPSESPRFRDFFATAREKWEIEGRPGLVKADEAPKAQVTMAHSSPSQVEPDRPIALSARLTDPSHRVSSVRVYVRTGTKGRFESFGAKLEGTQVHATIPKSFARAPLVEYYLECLDETGVPVVTRGDAEAPLRIAVPDSSKSWVLPVAIGGGVLGAVAIVGGMALAGVFSSEPSRGSPGRTSTVTISIRE